MHGVCYDFTSSITHTEASAVRRQHSCNKMMMMTTMMMTGFWAKEGLLKCLQRALDCLGGKALPLNRTSQPWKGKWVGRLNPPGTPFQYLTPCEIREMKM